jgi:site-specific DNA recombinase
MHTLVESVLEDQIRRINDFACTELEKVMQEKKRSLAIKRARSAELESKIEKLEERLINDEIETITYKKWMTKLSAEKGSLQLEIETLQKNLSHPFQRLEQAIPVLTNLKALYSSLKLNGKQALLNKVFEGRLIYDGVQLRTPQLNSCLLHNYLKIKEKGLLVTEQPLENLGSSPVRTAYGIRTRITSVKGRRPSP